jgi:hypothetical protein
MSYPLADLRALPDDELIRAHDHLAQNTSVGIDYYLAELARRDALRQEGAIRRLTWVIAVLTAVITAATIVSMAFVIAK